ncbi:serpin B13 [Ictidomys tridecemlineatus]|uniref:Serpin B13 n=1 Tax=Ictidomys tridecemlineatus TaxID=43179 RepID=A0A287D246_ICTTR|nr:serpin B13 [Ictidomys tridecemlineatus]
MESLSAANIHLGLNLLKEMRKTNDGNIFFSPVGISTAIGMLLLGTRGATASQLQKVFYSEKDTEISRKEVEEKEDLSMFVLLPNDIEGLEKIIDQVTPEQLIEWTRLEFMEVRTVNLRLPRLQVEGSYELEPVLGALGLGAAFSESDADFSGMCARSGLQAQRFLHRSFVQVTEEGAEATVATGIGYMVSSAGGCEQVHCDHPFLFFIRHRGSDSVLFFGRFSSP